MTESKTEALEFKAEVAAVLKLVTNSLYTNREIFLRELISNASDALDKARFSALVDKELEGQEVAAKIEIVVDKRRGVLTVADTGIGLTREEAAQNLGTIAHSGTLEFMRHAAADRAEGKPVDAGLIGQFGVGFYSGFMVADRIEVHSQSAKPGHDPVQWASTGGNGFTIGEGVKAERGTRVELHLNDDAKEFLDGFRVEQIIKRYSNFVLHPIELTIVDDKGETVGEPRKVNAAKAFWAEDPKSLTDEDYAEFYTHVMGGFVLPGDEPLARSHLSLDAPIQFKSVLYIPGKRPADLFGEEGRALMLYARRVMVMERCDKLLPMYLRFFRGVVDSEDLPLNVSREMLQEHQSLAAIRRQLTRKALRLIEDTAKESPEKYETLWREFGVFLKEGLHTDNAHKETLIKLLRFESTASEGKLVSLAQYVESMKDDQPAVFFIVGESASALARSPHVETCRARGWPVLLMTDAVDEWVVQDLAEFEGKPLRSVTQGDLELGADGSGDEAKPDEANADESKSEGDASSEIEALLGAARALLGDRVKEVRASCRLTDSASCMVDAEGGLSRNMERILRAANRQVPTRARILELNPSHAFVRKADELARADAKSPELTDYVELLLDQARLSEGEVPDPPALVRRIQAMMDRVAGVGESSA